MENLFHITTQAGWARAVQAREYIADSLAKEGFIHCSFRSQVVDVANRFFRGQKGLLLLEVLPELLRATVKLEDLLNEGMLFPHVYGPINRDAVVKVHAFEGGTDGTFMLPSSITSP
jgi:uncharacterized protein (DUF952 family)